MPVTRTPALIAGAGPTGLILALSLVRRGIMPKLIDAHEGPAQESRAMGVHARTLEYYRQFGFASEVVEQGVRSDRIHLRRKGRQREDQDAGTFNLGNMGEGLSPFPFLLTYPQDLHERFLVGKLKALGVEVERNTKLLDFTQDSGGVRAVIGTKGQSSEIKAQYIAGCDGAHSRVREVLGIGFSGGTYEQLFYVADVEIEGGFEKDIYVNLGAKSLALMMPVRASGMQRLIGLVPKHLEDSKKVHFEDIRSEAEPLIGVRVTSVNWFSTYRVHHRVADRFRSGRAFIAGDAGHLHSPAGGQGMNTGIGDAINLGWKLAHVLSGRANAAILDTYEPERIPFARRLVATTDRAFEALINEGFKGEILRRWLVPAALNIATAFGTTRHAAFRTVSQIAISYPESALSDGEAGIKAGERLPWVPGDNGHDNFEPLASLDWQTHVYGEAADGVAQICSTLGLPLRVFPWTASASAAGFQRGAVYLVRPDGYIGLAATRDPATRLQNYVKRHDLKILPGTGTTA